MVVRMVCASPAWPPQATLAEVIERSSASCAPSAMASGSSPMSQFKSMACIRWQPKEKEFNTKITEEEGTEFREKRDSSSSLPKSSGEEPACYGGQAAGRPLLHNQ